MRAAICSHGINFNLELTAFLLRSKLPSNGSRNPRIGAPAPRRHKGANARTSFATY
jgi:hypothetical protein